MTGKKAKKHYNSSVQIIDVNEPWPPRWYTSTPEYTNAQYTDDTSKGFQRMFTYIDVREVGGYLSFYELLSFPKLVDAPLMGTKFAGYLLLNKNMVPADTVRSTDAIRNLFFHDLAINNKGERLVNLRKDTYLDLRDYTEDYSDTAVHCNVDYIQILNSEDSIIFFWNPLEHIDPKLFDFKRNVREKSWGGRNSPIIEWTRLTSVQWDYDGNIIYDMKNIGLGKISRQYGHIMWQITERDIPMFDGRDTIKWYNPHDFNFVAETDTSVIYSVYSNGTDFYGAGGLEPACGVVFEKNKVTGKISLVKVIKPKRVYAGNGQGNVSYTVNGNYVIAYGSFEEPDSLNNGFTSNVEYGCNDTTYGIFQYPRNNYCYKAHRLKDFPRPPARLLCAKAICLKPPGLPAPVFGTS